MTREGGTGPGSGSSQQSVNPVAIEESQARDDRSFTGKVGDSSQDGAFCFRGSYDESEHRHRQSLSLSLSLSLTHTLSLSLSHRLSLTQTLSLSLSLTHTHPLSLSLFLTLSSSLSLSLSHTHTHTHTLSFSLSHTHTHTLSLFHTLSPPLSLSHTHTHTHGNHVAPVSRDSLYIASGQRVSSPSRPRCTDAVPGLLSLTSLWSICLTRSSCSRRTWRHVPCCLLARDGLAISTLRDGQLIANCIVVIILMRT